METITLELADDLYQQLHQAAQEKGVSDAEYAKSLIGNALPLHLRSDEEIGAYLREKNKELYKRLS